MDFLPDIILLNIFDFWRIIDYPVRLWKSTWKWDRLVHVCQRWRQIVFASPNRLQIQLLCASGTPIKTHLSCWPAFPIILSYSVGEGLSISDEYNVLSALEHSNRIGTLDLTVTTTQLDKLVKVMQKSSYPALGCLVFAVNDSDDELPAVFPGAFLNGSVPCFMTARITRHFLPSVTGTSFIG